MSGAHHPQDQHISSNCLTHPFEATDRICVQCGGFYCDGCLVSPWGPRKPSLCVKCAIQRSGVRSKAGARKMMNSRDIRELERRRKKEGSAGRRNPVVIGGGPTLDKVALPPEGEFGDQPPKRGKRLLRRG